MEYIVHMLMLQSKFISYTNTQIIFITGMS